jgi:hypothetical protein
MKFFVIFLLIVFSSSAYSFPELTRHGYSNCTACHLSPAGGGALTLYGRELSKELLSTKSEKGEQYFAYNAIPSLSKSDKILLAAYIRGLQALRENKSYNEARTIPCRLILKQLIIQKIGLYWEQLEDKKFVKDWRVMAIFLAVATMHF